jgi:predicted lipid-binding transport protein (Tim44 family)
MCSTPVQRIAEIGQAIDDLAADAQAAYSAAGLRRQRPAGADTRPAQDAAPSDAAAAGQADQADPAHPADPAGSASSASDTDQVVIRLAELWALLAELDPEVARRLPTYEA